MDLCIKSGTVSGKFVPNIQSWALKINYAWKNDDGSDYEIE